MGVIGCHPNRRYIEIIRLDMKFKAPISVTISIAFGLIVLLGYFIEIMSGMPFDQFLKERIFDPLGMDDTWFYLPESKHDRLVSVQTKKNDKWIKYGVTPVYDPDYPIKGAKTFFAGGAGLSSTAKDYACGCSYSLCR